VLLAGSVHGGGTDFSGESFLARYFGCAVIGFLGGAFAVGKFRGKVSPMLTYAPAFILIAAGMYGVFYPAHPGAYFLTVALGLGGGLVLGRVNADFVEIVDGPIRGLALAMKALLPAVVLMMGVLILF